MPGHDAVTRNQLLVHPEISTSMGDQLVGLAKAPWIKELLDTRVRPAVAQDAGIA